MIHKVSFQFPSCLNTRAKELGKEGQQKDNNACYYSQEINLKNTIPAFNEG